VANAIKSLNERGGSSLRAIKKYIAANYEVDNEQLSAFIKEYLKTAVAAGKLVQTTGKGASGSFKLAAPKSKKAAVPTAPVRGCRSLSSAPELKKSNPPKVHKAKSTQKAAVKSSATPKKSPSKANHGAQVRTKKPKAARSKTPAKPKSTTMKNRQGR
jgi:histone H1/5